MKKYLIISYDYPLPEVTGGRMRTMNFVRYFLKHGSVDLAYIHSVYGEKGVKSPFRNEYCIKHSFVDKADEADKNIFSDFGDRFERLFHKRPQAIRKWSQNAKKELLSLIINNEYNYILCRYINNTLPLFDLPDEYKERIIVDYDDILTDSLYDTYFQYKGVSRGLKRALDRNFLHNYQKRCLQFGRAIFCSEIDQMRVSDKKRFGKTYIVPNTFPMNTVFKNDIGDGYEKRNVILFVGSLAYDPNVTGLKWFIETIFTYKKRFYTDLKMVVVGKNPGEEIKHLCDKDEDIELHENVPDMIPFYSKCGIVVVPLLSGGGTRIKILEAGIAERPVITTPQGAYGLDLRDGREIMLFTDREIFFSQCDALNERALYDSLVQSMKRTVLGKYSPSAFERAMDQVLSG